MPARLTGEERRATFLTIMVLTLAIVVLGITAGHGRDLDGRWAQSEHRDWYKSLKQPGSSASCCDLSDCLPVEFEAAGDHYRAFVDGGWIDIPPEKVIHPPTNPTGRAVLCSIKVYGLGRTIYCFAPGTMS